MSDGYLHNGKTIHCRATDKDRYTSLDDVNRNDVVVMVIAGRTRSSSHRDRFFSAQDSSDRLIFAFQAAKVM